MKQAIIILGHGSRNKNANAEFLSMVSKIADANTDAIVIPAYLEMAEPRLAATLTEALQLGATTIRVIPCLLFSGNHVSKDIPEIVAEFQAANPQITITITDPIGMDPLLLEIINQRITK